MKYDVVVIGAGPGGYVAAIRASQLGLKVACIEKEKTLGGTCLNVGCIPSKTLLQTSESFAWIQKEAKSQGIVTESPHLNFETMMARKDSVVKGLVEGVAYQFKKNKIDWISGTASFINPNKIKVGEKEIEGNTFILASGSEPISLPFLPFDETKILSSTGALSLKSVPKKMLVIGAGSIGLEMASVYQRLGSQVTVVEMLDRVCPALDPLISRQLLVSLKKQGLEFFLPAKVLKGGTDQEGVYLDIHDGKQEITLKADVVLVAVGRRPFTKGLQLENAQLSTNSKGMIAVDSQFRTQVPHIYAIGDLIDGPMLAHKASDEGIAVAELIAGHKTHIDYMTIPNVVYTEPEAAAVGLTETEAKEMKLEIFTGTAFYKGNARARCMGTQEGVAKVIGEKKSGLLLGLHLLAPHASEMIGEGVIAITKRMTVAELAKASHAHPSLSEAIKEAAEAALGYAIHGA